MSTSILHSNARKPNIFQSSEEKPNIPKFEEKSGDVILVGPGNSKRYVHIKIYRTSLEHFAVVFPLKRISSKPLGIINLRNTVAEPLPFQSEQTGFLIRQRVFDTATCLTILCKSTAEVTQWLNAFSSRSSPSVIHHSSLPIVEEEE